MQTKVTVKGQVTISKNVRNAAGIQPGDMVTVRARAEGGVIIEGVRREAIDLEYLKVLQDMSQRKPIKGVTTDEYMSFIRGDD